MNASKLADLKGRCVEAMLAVVRERKALLAYERANAQILTLLVKGKHAKGI